MWSSGIKIKSQRSLVNTLINSDIIKTAAVARAFEKCDRKLFVPENLGHLAYEDTPLPIGCSQTISAPHIHAAALELLLPAIPETIQEPETVKILDVGCGSGYVSALLALARPKASVYAIDCFPALVEQTKEHCTAVGGAASSVTPLLADGWKGLPDKAPFHAIHVGAGASSIPQALLDQLHVGGRMIIPIGNGSHRQEYLSIERHRKDADDSRTEKYTNSTEFTGDADLRCFSVKRLALVAFVPLIKEPAHVKNRHWHRRAEGPDSSQVMNDRETFKHP